MPPPKSLTLTTQIHPDAAQERRLIAMWTAVLTAQSILTRYLHHRAAAGPLSLLQVAAVPPGPWTPADGHRPRLPTVAQLDAEFRSVRDALGWIHAVPPSALRWMVAETAREWRRALNAPVLPRPWPATRAPHLHLDHGAQLLDTVTVEIAALGHEGRLAADLYLPGPYWRALVRRQRDRLAAEQAYQQRLEDRWLDHGDPAAAAELLTRRERADVRGELPDPGEARPGDPVARDRVVIRRLDGDGLPPRWVTGWAFGTAQVPFPRRTRDDVVGVDLGYTHPFAVVMDRNASLSQRPFRGNYTVPTSGTAGGLAWSRALAAHRRSLYLRLLPLHEQHLALVLQHRTVAVEAMAWGGFARRGLPFPDYARDVGLMAWLHWVEALAPHHGVRLVKVPPEHTSRICSACGRVGRRPRAGNPFHCRGCGHMQAADLNAATVIRARALATGRQW